MRLILVRHGQTPCNITGELDTAFPGAGLSPLGETQAAALPAAFAPHGIAGVYASRLVRTQLTAAPLAAARQLPITVVAGLEEIRAGSLEMRSDMESRGEYARCLESWMHGDLSRNMPHGPDGHAFVYRFDRALREIMERQSGSDPVVVFSHGAAIRVFTAARCGIDPNEATELQIMNTGGGIFEHVSGTSWNLQAWHTHPFGGRALGSSNVQDVTGGGAAMTQNQPA